MKLADMPEINPVDLTVNDVEKMLFTSYQNITGRTLGQADPVRLFVLFVADVLYRTCEKINYAGRQNFLRTAEGESLDALAANICTTRIPATAATTTIRATLSDKREEATLIPAGTRVSPENNIYFATDDDLLILAGATTGEVRATCTTIGTVGNNYQPGEISKIVDPIAYVATMVNITKSEGGAEEETDDSLRERVFEAPERFSTAGPKGAYEYHVKSASSLISDVCVWSPEPGKVQVSFLLTGGKIPGEEMQTLISETLSAEDVRPLTDQVEVVAPKTVSYDIDASYYIDSDADASTVQKNVSAAVDAYVLWQQEKLNRDIDPSELVRRIKAVSGTCNVIVTEPVYTDIGIDDTQIDATGTIEVAQANVISVKMLGRES